jgi:hypothetical protein
MTPLLRQATARLRAWLGLNDPSDNRLYPPHGWLLPEAALVRARYAAPFPPIVPRAGSQVRFEGGR